MESKPIAPEVELKKMRIEGELRLREAELALKHEELQVRLKEAELALRRHELQSQPKGEKKASLSSPLAIALITGLVGLIGAGVGNFLQNRANIQLEREKFELNSKQELSKFETTLILKAIETGDPSTALENLLFLTKTGYIKDPEGKIKAYYTSSQGQGPVLPAPASSSVTNNTNPAIDKVLPSEGTGYVAFNREPGGADQFGIDSTISAIQELGKVWASRHPDVPISIGDMSRKGGGTFPPHSNHRTGREFDIRPLTNNGRNEPTNIDASNYSRELTRELILLVKEKFSGAVIEFNDSQLVSEGLTRMVPGNDNHIHVELP